MATSVPPDENIIKGYLCEKLSLSSPDQVTRTECKAIGYQSAQSSYQVTTNGGKKVGIFVKTVSGEANELSKVMDKEVIMYGKLIPEVTKFVERNDSELAEQVKSCFVKYYGLIQETGENPQESLILEDINYQKNMYLFGFAADQISNAAVENRNSVVRKLALNHAAFYAWQTRCHPGVTAEEMKEKYPALENYPTVINSRGFENMLTGVPPEKRSGFILQVMNSVVEKVISSHIGNIVTDVFEQSTILATMTKLASISCHMPGLIPATRNRDSHLACPILGSVTKINVAYSNDGSGKVIFYDFGLAGFASPLMDLQWFLGVESTAGFSDNEMKSLLEIYVSQFVSVSGKLGVNVERVELIKEFHATKIGHQIINLIFVASSFFVCLKQMGNSEEVVQKFVINMMSLDANKDMSEIKDAVGKILGQETLMKVVSAVVNVLKKMDGCVSEIERLIEEKEHEK